MTRRRSAAATASLIGFVCGCAASTERDSKVTAIDPATAFNDAAFIAQIQGGLFRPTYDFDTKAASAATEVATFSSVLQPVDGPATAAIPLDGVAWQSPTALTATVPAGVPAGRYDVVVKDPRGRRMQLDGGFVSLGADAEAPVVTESESAVCEVIACKPCGSRPSDGPERGSARRSRASSPCCRCPCRGRSSAPDRRAGCGRRQAPRYR